MRKHCFEFGTVIVGWIPDDKMQSGGRNCIFRSKKEYEEVYEKRLKEMKPSLDSLIAKAGISGGKARFSIDRRGR